MSQSPYSPLRQMLKKTPEQPKQKKAPKAPKAPKAQTSSLLSKLNPHRIPTALRIATLSTIAVATAAFYISNNKMDFERITPEPTAPAPIEAPAKISEEAPAKASVAPKKTAAELKAEAEIAAVRAELAQQKAILDKERAAIEQMKAEMNAQKEAAQKNTKQPEDEKPTAPEAMTVDEAGQYGANNIEEVAQELKAQGFDTSALQGMREMMANGNPLEANDAIINNGKGFNQQFVELSQGMTVVEQMEFIQKHFGDLTPAEVKQGLADGTLNQRLHEAMAGKSTQQLKTENQAMSQQLNQSTQKLSQAPSSDTIYKINRGLRTELLNHKKKPTFDSVSLTNEEKATLAGTAEKPGNMPAMLMGVCELVQQGYIEGEGKGKVSLADIEGNRITTAMGILHSHVCHDLMKKNKGDSPMLTSSKVNKLLNGKTLTAEKIAIALHLTNVPMEYNSQLTGVDSQSIKELALKWCDANGLKHPRARWEKVKGAGSYLKEKAGSAVKSVTSMNNPKLQEHLKNLMGNPGHDTDHSAIV